MVLQIPTTSVNHYGEKGPTGLEEVYIKKAA